MANTNSAETQTNGGPQFQTINKLWEFPIISSAWTQSSGLYNRVKECSPLLNNALTTAESTVQFAAATASPTVQKFHAPLSMVDQTLTRGLNSLEQRVPIVKAEPAVLYEGAKSYITAKVTDVRQNITFFAEQCIDHYLPLPNEPQDVNSNAYQEVSALTTDQDKILFTIQTIGRIAGKLKRGVSIGIAQIPRQALDFLNNSPLMINLASYLNLVNQHLARQQSSQTPAT
ncbi:hypothetical protein M8J75_009956 [Diaphorina citri]|nr:hypothetical protein M8J75_009956 [Diaphorina citri]